MRNRNEIIIEWVIRKIREKYRNDVAILAIYGSFVNNTSNLLSDVDFFFIPKTQRGYELSKTFIVDGIGYDLFPMSWDRVEGLSRLKEPLAPLLGDSVVAYSDSAEDLARFMGLRETLAANVANKAFMHDKALVLISKALSAWESSKNKNSISDLRLAAGKVLMLLCDAVAYENQTYFHRGLKKQYEDLLAMQSLPVGFLEGYDAAIRSKSAEGIKSIIGSLFESCLGFLSEGKQKSEPPMASSQSQSVPSQEAKTGDCGSYNQTVDYTALVSFYEEAVSGFNKIYHCCDTAVMDYRLAFISAVCLQRVLDEEVPGIRFDLLGGFDYSDLRSFAESVAQSESRLVSYISRGAAIRRYKNVEDFLADNDN